MDALKGDRLIFEFYRFEMCQRLLSHRDFFREPFLDVLRYHPSLPCDASSRDAFRLRISISIKGDKVQAKSLSIELFDQNPNPWTERFHECKRDIEEWNRENMGQCAGIGIVIFEFKVNCPGYLVLFELQLELPLAHSELVQEGGGYRLGSEWASAIAELLSDDEPTNETFVFYDGLCDRID